MTSVSEKITEFEVWNQKHNGGRVKRATPSYAIDFQFTEPKRSTYQDLIDSYREAYVQQQHAYLVDPHSQHVHWALPKADVKLSRIRVQLSRPLTIAESEHLTHNHHAIKARVTNALGLKVRVSPNGTHVWVDAAMDSRSVFEVVSAALASHFVNVFPTAVRTFTEYNGN